MATPNLTLTPAAEKFMRRIVRFSGTPGAGFRLLVSAGGCSGYSTAFSAEAQALPGDVTLEPADGLLLFLPAESRVLLEGATVDFADTPIQSGLVVTGGAAQGCGCSSSAPIPAPATVPLQSLLRR